MKKSNVLVLIMCILIGCSNQNIDDTTKIVRNQDISKEHKVVNDNEMLTITENQYMSTIIFEGTKEPNINIRFPQISGLDKGIVSKINKSIETSTIGEVKISDVYNTSDERIYLDYEVYANEKILSIKFTGGLADGRNKLVGTLNYDLTTGEQVKFTDLYEIDESFIDYLFNENYQHEDERIVRSHQYIVDNYYENILDSIKDSDTSNYFVNGEEDKVYVYTYYKKDTLEVIFYHGFSALGSFYSEEVSYDEMNQFKNR